MRAGRRSMTSCSARCSNAAGTPPSRPPNGSAAAFSKSASAPAFRCRIIRKDCQLSGVDISEPMLRKAQERVAEFGLTNVEGLWVMDAEHLSFPDASFDVDRRAICHHHGAESRGDARRIRPRAQAGRRDHPGQPRRRRSRPAALAGALVPAGGAQARLAVGILVRALLALGAADRRACICSSAAPCRRSGISR